MDYGRILTRAWEIIRDNLFLIILGMLVALGSTNGSSGNSGSGNSPFPPNGTVTPVPGEGVQGTPPDFSQMLNSPDQALGLLAMGMGVALAVVGVLLIIKIIFWIISRIASGGLIAGVDQIERSGTSSFALAWGAGWEKKGRLIGIGLIPVLPLLAGLAVTIVAVIAMLGGFSALAGDVDVLYRDVAANASIILVVAAIMCPTLLLTVALEIVSYFAERACMLEDKTFSESFARGWDVLKSNLSSAIILALLQIGIQIVLFLLLLVPSVVLACCCCCIAWLVFLVDDGVIKTYFSTVWTLAWRQWTGGEAAGSFTIEKAPAV